MWTIASSAQADEAGIGLDLTIFPLLESLSTGTLCSGLPDGSREACLYNEFDALSDQQDGDRFTAIDHLAMIFDRYKDLRLNTDIAPGTKLKFVAEVDTFQTMEAKVQISLRFRF